VASTAALLSATRPGSGAAAGPIQAIPRDEPGDLDGLDDLSDEEVDARLRELLAADTEEQGDEQ
jgi:hypothetical protein